MIGIHLAVEDEVSEQVALRLIGEHPSLGLRGEPRRRGGFGYLKKNLGNFCNLARTQPVFLLTDLDHAPCPGGLIRDWLGKETAPPDLLFRVAVREVEAWILADHANLPLLFERKTVKAPPDPESLPDPKRHLLKLAEKASGPVKRDLLPKDKDAATAQGLNYNARLVAFVQEHWDPARAAANAPSLARARRRLTELATRAPMDAPAPDRL